MATWIVLAHAKATIPQRSSTFSCPGRMKYQSAQPKAETYVGHQIRLELFGPPYTLHTHSRHTPSASQPARSETLAHCCVGGWALAGQKSSIDHSVVGALWRIHISCSLASETLHTRGRVSIDPSVVAALPRMTPRPVHATSTARFSDPEPSGRSGLTSLTYIILSTAPGRLTPT